MFNDFNFSKLLPLELWALCSEKKAITLLSVTNSFFNFNFFMFSLFKVRNCINRNSAKFRQILMNRF